MMPIFVIAVLAALVWLMVKSRRAADQIENLTARCDRLEDELRRLRREETKVVAPGRQLLFRQILKSNRTFFATVGAFMIIFAIIALCF